MTKLRNSAKTPFLVCDVNVQKSFLNEKWISIPQYNANSSEISQISLRRTLLTCQGLVPLANAVGLSTESFNVFQVGLWVQKPLCLRWGGHKHGRCWLLYDRGGSWMGARIRRWCLLPWRPQNSYLKEHRAHDEGKKIPDTCSEKEGNMNSVKS